MHHAEAHELCLLEARNQPQHARLSAPFDLRLEADEAEVIAGEIVLPQLHGGVGLPSGARIDQPDRLHRTEAERVVAAMRHHLDRQTAFEEPLLVEVVNRGRFRGNERVVEAIVLFAREGAIQVVAFPTVDTARPCWWLGDPT